MNDHIHSIKGVALIPFAEVPDDRLLEQVNVRRTALKYMTGDLFPAILEAECNKLLSRFKELKGDGVLISLADIATDRVEEQIKMRIAMAQETDSGLMRATFLSEASFLCDCLYVKEAFDINQEGAT